MKQFYLHSVDPWKSTGAGRSLGAGNRYLYLWEAVGHWEQVTAFLR